MVECCPAAGGHGVDRGRRYCAVNGVRLNKLDGIGKGDDRDGVFRRQAGQEAARCHFRLLKRSAHHAGTGIQRKDHIDRERRIKSLRYRRNRQGLPIELHCEVGFVKGRQRPLVCVQDRDDGLRSRPVVGRETANGNREARVLRRRIPRRERQRGKQQQC